MRRESSIAEQGPKIRFREPVFRRRPCVSGLTLRLYPTGNMHEIEKGNFAVFLSHSLTSPYRMRKRNMHMQQIRITAYSDRGASQNGVQIRRQSPEELELRGGLIPKAAAHVILAASNAAS